MTHRARLLLLSSVLIAGTAAAPAAELEEWKIKRQDEFAFAQPPVVTREGDRVSIAFEAKGACDATVVLEDANGRIIRHLGSGVLGKNAPPPFQKDALKQVIVWDGKDDQGKYVDDKDSHTVRVSLGLKPQFERSLFWSPHKRISNIAPLLCATPEGVVVCEGQGIDTIKLFDHDGKYLRTIYPFPAGKIGEVKGLATMVYPQDGQTLPVRNGYHLGTMLTCGSSAFPSDEEGHMGGYPASAMAHHGGRLAVAYAKLNRLHLDGTSGGLPLEGPETCFRIPRREKSDQIVGPTSMAFSPDGKWLYLTGYVMKTGYWAHDGDAFHGVWRMEFAGDKPPELWMGKKARDEGYGSDDKSFCVPTSVDTDSSGRVYVSDFANQRIQVFAPDGKLLKSLKTLYPARVAIDPKTQEILSFSFSTIGASRKVQTERNLEPHKITPTLAKLGTFDKPAAGKSEALPFGAGDLRGGWFETGGQAYQVAVDSYGAQTAVWVVGRKPTLSVAELNWSGGGTEQMMGWAGRGVKVLAEKGGKWTTLCDFGQETLQQAVLADPPDFSRARLHVNPATGKLYVGQDKAFCKSFDEMLAIDPDTGKMKMIELPFDAEDLVIDLNENVYMRTDTDVMRFNFRTWREVPWDYGEERAKVWFQHFSAPRRASPAIASLPIPGSRPVWWHMSGMAINAKGNMAIVCNIRTQAQDRRPKDRDVFAGDLVGGKKYTMTQYPGRAGNRVILVFDRHGQLVHDDALPGMCNADGIGIDAYDDLYAMIAAPRIVNGKGYFNGMSETLVKVSPGRAKFVSDGDAPVPLDERTKPKREPDLVKGGIGRTWVEGAQWLYGGVGYGGAGGTCVCWHARMCLDYLGRSFAPELERSHVAVLDSAGNLILRLGKYGNADDGKPLAGEGSPANPRALGGDEVSLSYAAYLGTHTDRRLFIHDAGNGRILSVKLGYHTEQTIALKNVPEQQK